MRVMVLVISAALTVALSSTAQAFCGFYVAKADTDLFNSASQVVLVRDGDRTVLTMANDFEGDVKDFAMVIPVPTFIERGQINVADKALIDHLDAYTSPRLVEYFDPDPCARREYADMDVFKSGLPSTVMEQAARARAKGVTIEASYTVGEYDILILAAEESDGLIDWLNDSGYKIPRGAEKVVGSYLKQDMRFFVAKVNLEEQAKSGSTYLRPLQVAFESKKFMLPIRLGTLNAKGEQELFVYTLTRTGRVETSNYRTVKLPSNTEVPEFVQAEFPAFYRSMFEQQVEAQNRRAVFIEYAWDMAWCDPCAADPLSPDELRKLGVFWIDTPERGRVAPQAQNVFVTRLHVRYDQEHFPEDLMFQETGDRTNFQGRYVIRHAFDGKASCDISSYEAQLRERQEREAQQLANLTGWDINEIRDKIPMIADTRPEQPAPWWKRLWD
ncbi:MAG: DUF2330 domain-containing protein [Gammaproteobacteria bacterium]|nr:DUF2330 domain-containing protein [Gammaproteobacteria bacterium]